MIELDPNFYWAHRHLGQAYEQKGLFDDAIAELEKAVKLSQRNAHVLASLGYVYAMAGRREDAQGVLDTLIDEPERDGASPYDIALVYVGLGEDDKAFQWLERAYRERDGVMTHLKVTPKLDRLRSDPRYQDLLRRIGLAP